jgi:hypothetical protein
VFSSSSSRAVEDEDEDGLPKGDFSKYDETSNAVKNLVSGLTRVVNAFGDAFGVGANETARDADRSTRKERREARPFPSVARDPERLRDDIAREFTEKKYLWTGDINPEMYDLFATFCDPTLAFAGLDTFERNLKNLQPVLSRLVRDSEIELYDCALVSGAADGKSPASDEKKIRAAWRMTGNLRVPWRPRIDLKGRTTFTFKDYGGRRGCLITAYQEEWEVSAGEAVGQLARPFRW